MLWRSAILTVLSHYSWQSLVPSRPPIIVLKRALLLLHGQEQYCIQYYSMVFDVKGSYLFSVYRNVKVLYVSENLYPVCISYYSYLNKKLVKLIVYCAY
jgi:hypothetical protein